MAEIDDDAWGDEDELDKLPDDTEDPLSLAIDETPELIASDKVGGTAVYDGQGERLGSIQNFMVEKQSGQVAYAVLKFGGFLGVSEDHFPLPWAALSYDRALGGYVVALDKATLEAAPRYGAQTPLFDRLYGQQVYAAYGLTYPF